MTRRPTNESWAGRPKAKIRGSIAFAAMVVLVLSACSGAAETGDGSTEPEASEAAAADSTGEAADADSTEQQTDDSNAADSTENEAVEPDVLTVGYVSESYNYLPLYVAIDEGYFEDREVEVAAISLASSSRATAALIGGSVDATLSAPGQTILATSKGEAIQVVGGLVNAAMYTLVGQEGVDSLSALAGKRIGVAGAGTGDVLLLDSMFEAEGIDPEAEGMSYIEVGGTPERWAALQSGAIDAGMLLSPLNYSALKDGYARTANAYDYVTDFQHTAINAKADRTPGTQEAMVRMLLGLRDAVEAIKSDPELAHRVAMERLEIEQDLAELAYEDYLGADAFPDDMSFDEAGVEVVAGQLVTAGDLDEATRPSASDYTDKSVIEEAERRAG